VNQLAGRKDDGSRFMMLVLEPGNLKRLREGKPIMVRLEDMFMDLPQGFRCEIVIAFSETPIADAKEFAKKADVVLDERTPKAQAKRPKCGACDSTIEQMGMWKSDGAPGVCFCPNCGVVLGVLPA